LKKITALFLAAIIIMLSSSAVFADSGYDYYEGYEKEYYYEDGSPDNITPVEVLAVMGIIISVLLVGMLRDAADDKLSGKEKTSVPERKPIIDEAEASGEQNPLFSKEKFLGEISETYLKIQDCRSAGDISSLRSCFTEELFEKTEKQINEYLSRGETNHIEKAAVLGTRIIGFEKDSENDVITVEINSKITDYVTDDRTGEIIRGDRNSELFVTCRWTCICSPGKLTGEESDIPEAESPGWGWVISDIQEISRES